MPSMFRLSRSPRQQRGDILLEALIGTLLMGIVGLGLVYSASRVAISQKDMNQQNIVVSQMRSLLQQRGQTLCSGTAPSIKMPPDISIELTVSCSSAPATVSIAGTSIEVGEKVRWVALQTAAKHNDLFGGGAIRVGDTQ